MHGFLRHSLVVAASLAICVPALAPLSAAAAQSPTAELSLDDLRELESLLQELGFDPGAVDGTVDQRTLAAIERYQEFASLPGDPAPSPALLTELRGVAAAFAALRNDDQTSSSTPVAAPGSAEQSDGALSEAPATEEREAAAPDPAEKVIVPPPPMPPKLKPVDAAPAPEPEAPQLAARPPQEAETPLQNQPTEQAPAPGPPADPPPPETNQVSPIDAELAPYRRDLSNGNISREDLAKQFNLEGRRLLQTANYDEAILKFDVAIFLNPRFAGAYSNRGTAYELLEDRERAAKDFEKARELGFGGVRPQTRQNPLR